MSMQRPLKGVLQYSVVLHTSTTAALVELGSRHRATVILRGMICFSFPPRQFYTAFALLSRLGTNWCSLCAAPLQYLHAALICRTARTASRRTRYQRCSTTTTGG